jgi:hypothetical protein
MPQDMPKVIGGMNTLRERGVAKIAVSAVLLAELLEYGIAPHSRISSEKVGDNGTSQLLPLASLTHVPPSFAKPFATQVPLCGRNHSGGAVLPLA